MPEDTENTLQLKAQAMKSFGVRLGQKLTTYKSDRRLRDIQALKDLRQYRGEYDPEIKAEMDPKRSKVYPRDTRLKLLGFTAKMMEMMFPAQEKNWTLEPSENPNIAPEDLQQIVQSLQQAQLAQAQQTRQPPAPLTSEDIETAVRQFAKNRAQAMETEIEDQLEDLEPAYPVLCKHNLHAGGLYGIGVLAGPFTVWKMESTWEQNPQTGQWAPVARKLPRPMLERRRFWDIYPDLSAKSWNTQEGLFDRMVLSRHQLLKLTERQDFYGDVIKQWLSANNEGNYKAETYDRELSILDETQNIQNLSGRRYEIYRYLGFVSAKELASIGVEIPEKDLHKDLLCDIWLLNDTIIKAAPAAFGDHVGDHYHPYLYNDEEEAGLTGVSLPQDVRDSQMKLCAVDRMVMDNGAACCGPITEIDESRLSRKRKDQAVDIGAFSSIYVDRSENPNDSSPVVREIQIESHIADLLAVRKQVAEQFDMESGLPSWTMGASPDKLGEAFRTSGNMSQMNGGANIVTKDQVRAFDRFTASVIGSMVKWNMEFNPKKEIKGDVNVIPRGSISLVAKEVRGAALDQMMQTLTPREQVIIKTRESLIERFRSRDLPTDTIMDEKEAAAALAQFDQQQAAAQQAQSDNLNAKTQKDSAAAQLNSAKAQEIQSTIDAKVGDLVAKAHAALAKAKGAQDGQQLDALKLILDQINTTTGQGGEAATGSGGGQ